MCLVAGKRLASRIQYGSNRCTHVLPTKLEVKAKVACILAYVIFVLIYVLINVIVANWYDCFECCCFAGPLDQFGSWGRRESVWIAVRGQA